MFRSPALASVLLLSCIALILGCGGPPVGKVSGKVIYKDAPVAEGSVIFQNGDGTVSMSANLGADGTYTVTSVDRNGLPPGEYKVAVSPSKIGSGESPLAIAPGEAPPPPPAIPAKYHSIETSDLKATVKAGDNPPFDFTLQD